VCILFDGECSQGIVVNYFSEMTAGSQRRAMSSLSAGLGVNLVHSCEICSGTGQTISRHPVHPSPLRSVMFLWSFHQLIKGVKTANEVRVTSQPRAGSLAI
jgi:hypothetical protein